MDPTNPFLASTALAGGNMQPGAVQAPTQPGQQMPTVITPQQLAMHPSVAGNPYIQSLMEKYGGQIAPMIQAIQTAHPQLFQHFIQSPWGMAGRLQQFIQPQPAPGQGPIMQPLHPAPMQPMGVAPTGVMPTNPVAGDGFGGYGNQGMGHSTVGGIARQPGAPGFGL